MNEMDISVIMPAYNAENYIGIALESAVTQCFNGTFEILVADDLSTDGTRQVIMEWHNKYPTLIKPIFRERNLGCSENSYQICINSSAKYLAFLDSDDCWATCDKLQLQYDFFQNNREVGMLCANAYYEKGQFAKENLLSLPYTKHQSGFVSFSDIVRKHTDVFNSGIMIRGDLYRQMAEDCKWYLENKCFFDTVWAYWFSYYGKLYRMEQILSSYRVLDNSDCHTTDPQKQFELAKRYYAMKTRFLLTHDVPIEEKMDVFLNEYDYNFRNAFFQGEQKVRKTRTFKMGSLLKKLKL